MVQVLIFRLRVWGFPNPPAECTKFIWAALTTMTINREPQEILTLFPEDSPPEASVDRSPWDPAFCII